MVVSWYTFAEPTRAANGDEDIDYSKLVDYKSLYIREADENTMDSYIQASLGGYNYLQWGELDGVTIPTVRNNYGTRYAGEVWADKSVFALGQEVIAEIRPFEAGHVYKPITTVEANDGSITISGVLVSTIYNNYGNVYKIKKDASGNEQTNAAGDYIYEKVTKGENGTFYTDGATRAIQTLNRWVIKSQNLTEATTINIPNCDINTVGELKGKLAGGTLTTDEANALNAAVNKGIAAEYPDKSNIPAKDGDFDGQTLYLGRHTDGIDAQITMDEFSDFLEVFSVLGSSEVDNDAYATPLDVLFVLDASGSMVDGIGDLASTEAEHYVAYYDEDSKSYKRAKQDGNGEYVKVNAGGKQEGEDGATGPFVYYATDDNEPIIDPSLIHENVNSRLEYASEALNNAFKTLMGANNFNRVALVTYNQGVEEVLPLGRYSPTPVYRESWQSEGYLNSKEGDEGRYFTIAKDGYRWWAWAEGQPMYVTGDIATDDLVLYVGGTLVGGKDTIGGAVTANASNITGNPATYDLKQVEDENGNKVWYAFARNTQDANLTVDKAAKNSDGSYVYVSHEKVPYDVATKRKDNRLNIPDTTLEDYSIVTFKVAVAVGDDRFDNSVVSYNQLQYGRTYNSTNPNSKYKPG